MRVEISNEGLHKLLLKMKQLKGDAQDQAKSGYHESAAQYRGEYNTIHQTLTALGIIHLIQ